MFVINPYLSGRVRNCPPSKKKKYIYINKTNHPLPSFGQDRSSVDVLFSIRQDYSQRWTSQRLCAGTVIYYRSMLAIPQPACRVWQSVKISSLFSLGVLEAEVLHVYGCCCGVESQRSRSTFCDSVLCPQYTPCDTFSSSRQGCSGKKPNKFQHCRTFHSMRQACPLTLMTVTLSI